MCYAGGAEEKGKVKAGQIVPSEDPKYQVTVIITKQVLGQSSSCYIRIS